MKTNRLTRLNEQRDWLANNITIDLSTSWTKQSPTQILKDDG